jgi:hypothetical protein
MGVQNGCPKLVSKVQKKSSKKNSKKSSKNYFNTSSVFPSLFKALNVVGLISMTCKDLVNSRVEASDSDDPERLVSGIPNERCPDMPEKCDFLAASTECSAGSNDHFVVVGVPS